MFVGTLYKKLHVATQIQDRICKEVFAPTEGVQEAMAINNLFSVCSHVLWACFKTHDVMADYIDLLQIENHPSIAAEYVKFLATNSGHKKVDMLETSIKDQQKDVTAALTKAKVAVSKADIATGKCETVKAQLNALTIRVFALEKADNHHTK